jgi:toxin ParE1/3/4
VKFKLEFHPLARVDLVEASLWYEEREAGLGERLESEDKALLRDLADDALLYPVRFHNIRRANLRSFPCGVFYFLAGETVVVLAVFHAARDSEATLRARRDSLSK